ncbi:MAG: decarboxylating NADP(+)-dependent phosphogluconate dehydrogenase [Chitinispirillales bacterium]|jgi:6-phosphogluconate dehydrogenase|nr:decarboxylating NADP(+)-dependent phosphogluconate dehydrogenase [Chitinispirillales bacterium]
MDNKCDIGVIGLAVMGRNLILNMNDKGKSVAVYNRTVSKVDDFLKGDAAGRGTIVGTHSLKELCAKLKRPRKVMLMVKAGTAVDEFIEHALPFLEEGDCIIDGGNSFFKDSIRRTDYLTKKGILFCGAGISGGEEGARHGPSIMPGGNPEVWPLLKDIFQSVSAKTISGEPCCDWVGTDGAGHYVKMIHNGIEYGDMQLISEAYSLLKDVIGMDYTEIAETFKQWNKTELDSYLIEITAKIFYFKDDDGEPLVKKILDRAGQKGTGVWTSVNSLELGVPVTLITEAVYARALSARLDERAAASLILKGPEISLTHDKWQMAEDIRKGLLASKIISYAQGFMLMKEAAKEYSWNLDFGNIASLWREGCIIRSVFLDNIKSAFKKNSDLQNLLFDDYFSGILADCQESWRRVACSAVTSGIAAPALCAALSFYDGYRRAASPANLLQAQRDYFGAHTYERVDKPRGEFFNTDWTRN